MLNSWCRVGLLQDKATGLIVSTVWPTDTGKYETAIEHPDYYRTLIIVEEYTRKREAEKGHLKWVKQMTEEPLPDSLIDIITGDIYARISSNN